MSDSRKSFDEWMAIPVAEGADPANWIGSYAEAVAWETWQARDAEIATLQRELAAAKAEAQQWQTELAIYKATENERIKHLESWKESVLAEVGQCPVESPQSRSSAYFQQCAEHLAARLVEAQKMLVSIRDGGLIPAHFKRTHAKLAELIGLDDGRRHFDDFIDELSPVPKSGEQS